MAAVAGLGFGVGWLGLGVGLTGLFSWLRVGVLGLLDVVSSETSGGEAVRTSQSGYDHARSEKNLKMVEIYFITALLVCSSLHSP